MNPSPHFFHIPTNRRSLLQSLLLTSGGIFTADLYAEALTLTPSSTEGPYYPDHLPLDQDNDLLQIFGGISPALGVVTEFGGRLLNADGKPVAGAVVELWQADHNGCYLHSRGELQGKERDPLFQGFGKITTNKKGEYRFRTIKPGLYTGRTIHWHIAVNQEGKRLLTTQLFMAGVTQNDRDGVLKGMGTAEERLSVIREFLPSPKASNELVGTWDIVLGATPPEPRGRPKDGPGRRPPGAEPPSPSR